jgi:hypothetical protein
MSFKPQDKFNRDFLNTVIPETPAFMLGDPTKALLGS